MKKSFHGNRTVEYKRYSRTFWFNHTHQTRNSLITEWNEMNEWNWNSFIIAAISNRAQLRVWVLGVSRPGAGSFQHNPSCVTSNRLLNHTAPFSSSLWNGRTGTINSLICGEDQLMQFMKINNHPTAVSLEVMMPVFSLWSYNHYHHLLFQFSSAHSLSHVWLFETPWTAAHQASLSITNSRSLLKLMSIESGMPSNHLSLCRPLVPLSSIFPAPGSFLMSQFFASRGQSIGVLASVLPVNIQDWFPLGWTGWIPLLSKRLSRFFSDMTVQKHQSFGAQLSL